MANRAVVTRTLAGCIVGATGVFALSGPVSAQTDQVCQTASFGDFQLLNPQTPVTPTAAIELDAGVVNITHAHSWDGYPARVGVDQDSEIWFAEFIGADGSVVGTSGPTTDLEDLVLEAHWEGSLGEVTLSAPAVGVRARHLPGVAGDNSPNSVNASEITVCVDVVVPTTTTEAPTTTTTAPTTAPPPSGPTITEPATTTTVTVPESTTTSAPAPKGPTLPVTGSESTMLLLGGMWLVAAGSTMVAFGRTR